jgi:L-malate glycosyltransferase
MRSAPFNRVLHVCSGDLWGGAEALVRDLIIAQAAEGSLEPHCAVLNEGQLAQSLREAGMPILQLDERRMGFAPLLQALTEYCRVTRPVVIHTHRVKEHVLGGLARIAAGLTGSRCAAVGTVHGRPEVLRSGRKVRDALVRTAERFALAMLLKRVALVSRDLQHSAARDLWPARCAVVHNGIDLRRVRTEATLGRDGTLPQRAASEILLVSAGRLVPVKRFDRLAAIAAEAHQASGRAVRVLLLGEGPLGEALSAQFAHLPPGVRIEMRGFVRNAASFVQLCDGLLMPSDHEGLPMTALEAAALGAPLFGFHTGGLPEVIEQGAPGFLAPLGDCVALGRGIARHLEEHRTSAGLLPGEQEWYFSIDACRRRYQDLYMTALGARLPGPVSAAARQAR